MKSPSVLSVFIPACVLLLALFLGPSMAYAAPPPNDECADAIVVTEGEIPFSTVGATTDGPVEPTLCSHLGDTQVGADIWFCYTPSCTGTVTMSLCKGRIYDTKLAVYEGCACPEPDTAIACSDDWCGSPGNPRQSSVTLPVWAGTSYLIRVGGHTSSGEVPAQGAGTLAITNVNCDGEPPDLIINGAVANPEVVSATFGPTNCAVQAGCVQPGTRKLLRFQQETRNIGAGDLVIGRREEVNPLQRLDACDGRFHFDGLAAYRLVGPDGVVASGRKSGFNIIDSFRHSPTAVISKVYDRSYNGIQAGWADVYHAGLPCQWVDVTDVPGGAYTLEMEVNPDRVVLEADYSNNVTFVPVILPCAGAPELLSVMPGLGADDPRPLGGRNAFIWPESRNVGLDRVEIEMNLEVHLAGADPWCTTTASGGSAPSVVDLVAGPDGVHTVKFDGPVPLGEWMTVSLNVANACGDEAEISFCVAHLPGDVDQSGAVTLNDPTRFGLLFPNGPNALLDVDGNGQVNLNDATKFGQLWNGTSGEGDPEGGGWNGKVLSPKPVCACPQP